MSSMTIPLTRGKVAIVDADDYDRVSQFTWCAFKTGHMWYASTWQTATGRHVYLHRFVMNAPAGIKVDHLDRDGLNNRRGNLRLATNVQNGQNHRPLSNDTSGYIGVCFHKPSRLWIAKLRVNRTVHMVGYFHDRETAAIARDAAAREFHGEFAILNFPHHH